MTTAEKLPYGVSLQEARQWLYDRREAGAECPCCSQFSKVYRRKLNSGMASALCFMYAAHGLEWQNKTVTLRGWGPAARDESLLRHWGLLQEDTRSREDGGHSGWWRVTSKGEQFVLGQIRVPSHIRIYANHYLGQSGDLVKMTDCLLSNFNLDELMNTYGRAS